MNYTLLKDTINLLERFEAEIQHSEDSSNTINDFKSWIAESNKEVKPIMMEPEWEGKEKGRSPESVINTLIVHMNRYAKTYSKAAMHDSDFSTQEEFIYLINLKAKGAMSKMELIKMNIQEKPAGMQIINRMLKQGWIEQNDSQTDKRSKIIAITPKGLQALEHQMENIRQATKIVTGDLSYNEKMELIKLLKKLKDFHHPIFSKNLPSSQLLETVLKNYQTHNN
ncbi:MAG: winged helix DNA-binding protein [Chitinophagales bacterium]|nr:winged helix DNA-binding protein [Chitinophagales bacterium]